MTNRSARNTAIAIVAVTGLLVAVIAACRALRTSERHVDPDRSRYPVAGIDLSAHNGLPDFDSVAAAGISFVYLKASEGEDFLDQAFVRNYICARDAGLAVGAYHFFRFDCDGHRQALNLLRAIEGCRLDMPVAIDIEESGNPASFATDFIISRLEAMVATLRENGTDVMIYTNKNGYGRFYRSIFAGTPDKPGLWICSFTDPPIPRSQWVMWQHSHISRVPGIEGKVDMNTFNGTSDQWRRWLAEHRPKYRPPTQ